MPGLLYIRPYYYWDGANKGLDRTGIMNDLEVRGMGGEGWERDGGESPRTLHPSWHACAHNSLGLTPTPAEEKIAEVMKVRRGG
ncbi:hypothetical protein DPEC_G00126480 [Dallia pectoralis]|uniref:Uncharacterized protein n=1 Tax=Dallia pectoralis TaxID=75939 RepID=A0ACC2GS44_DALPE|nr:hypothetical protein DPEC_G00126480 [Dallia pectoralis]